MMETWLDDYYADVDGMRLDAFLARHADDAVVQFGNSPPAKGKQEIAAAIGGLWDLLNSLSHRKVNTWYVDDHLAILEALVDYETKNAARVTVPAASFLERHDTGKIRSLRVYIDLAPLFSAVGSGEP
jgi:ketosteroid isomerase-like protein